MTDSARRRLAQKVGDLLTRAEIRICAARGNALSWLEYKAERDRDIEKFHANLDAAVARIEDALKIDFYQGDKK